MRHLTLMCAGLALAMLMNTDGGSGTGLMNVSDGADEPSSGGGGAEGQPNVNVEHADQVVGGEVAGSSDEPDGDDGDDGDQGDEPDGGEDD